MAVTKLGLYNQALMLLGQRQLATDTEDRPARFYLDTVFDNQGIDYCLEVVKPVFASIVAKLDTPAAVTDHGLAFAHTLPADYISMVMAYSDAELNQPIGRLITTGKIVECDFDTIFIRYTANSLAFTDWTPSFERVVAAYFAREISVKVSPDAYALIDSKFGDRVEAAQALEGEKEPQRRSTTPIGTLTPELLKIYNDALFIMGLRELTTDDDDSNRRVKLDRAMANDLVEGVLESTGWTFATTSVEMFNDPSLEPDWGYTFGFVKPDNLLRLRGIWLDDRFRNPIKYYVDEGPNWFCEYNTIYVQYIKTELLTVLADWPVFFRKLVSAQLAKDAALSLADEGANAERAEFEYNKRKSEARSNDAMQSPPRVLSEGTWSRSRSPKGYDSDKRK